MKKRTSLTTSQGFTLVELLIASALLSLILLTATYSYSLFSTGWNKELGNFETTAKQTHSLATLQSIIDGVTPLIIEDNSKKWGFLFEGQKESLLSLSMNGIFDDQLPVVFKLSYEVDKKGQGYLLYQEVSTKNLLLINYEQEIKFTHQWIVLENIKSINWQYFGWRNFDTKAQYFFNNNLSNDALTWSDSFSGFERKLLPDKLIIAINQADSSVLTLRKTLMPVEPYIAKYKE